MASNPRLPPKKDVALALLEQSTVFVHLDPRGEDVRVPAGFKKQPQLVLQIGLNMAPPIPDLDIGDEGISCTLSFSKMPHYCWIPWDSVFALVGDNARAMVWPDDIPREVAAQAAQQRMQNKPALRAVPKAEAEPAPALRAEAKEEKPKKKRARKTAAKDDAKAKSPRPVGAARPEPVEQKPAAAPGRDATAAGPGDKPRRVLPPYLRVIK